MSSTISVRLDDQLSAFLDAMSKQTGRDKSDIVRDSLRKQLEIEKFRQLRSNLMPFAEAQGILTDEDMFDAIS